ncbi:hypothetical protein IWX90DRAFT_128057 [Phyllosticta citrichinensis]|uniref:DUF7730 domain-containing protein n=1 Tax=Phyllosticta citrichinensis TaxID=1130410 RepID=A0ABR1Y4J0_9PEZI
MVPSEGDLPTHSSRFSSYFIETSPMDPANKVSDTSYDDLFRLAPMTTAIEPVDPMPTAFLQDFVQIINLKPPSHRSNFSVKLRALKNTLQLKHMECKAPLRRSQPEQSSMLLGLPPEIREMIWKELVQGDYVTLMVKENRRYRNGLKNRGFWWQSMEWIHRDEIEMKDRADCEVKILRARHGISMSMLLACKQIHRELLGVYFRKAVIELNPVAPFRFEPLGPSFETLKPLSTMGVLANVRFITTSLKLDNKAPYAFMVEEALWLFRLLRLCPQIRMLRIQANFSHRFEPYPSDPMTLCDQAEEKMQLVASRAYELLPMLPRTVKGPRPVTVKNPTKDCTCKLNRQACRCTWVVAFVFHPEDDCFVNTDFHTPGEPDWSNQILFTRPRRRKNEGVIVNRLETQILNSPIWKPKTMLEIEPARDLPKEFSLDHLRASETYIPKQTLRKKWINNWRYRVLRKHSRFRPLDHSDLVSWFAEIDDD